MAASFSADSEEFVFRPLVFLRSTGAYKLRGSVPFSYTRTRVLSAFDSIGLPKQDYGLHSLRAGGASAAANARVPDRLFKRHGRWKSDKAKDGYIKDSVSFIVVGFIITGYLIFRISRSFSSHTARVDTPQLRLLVT